jgi:hypothetical protein
MLHAVHSQMRAADNQLQLNVPLGGMCVGNCYGQTTRVWQGAFKAGCGFVTTFVLLILLLCLFAIALNFLGPWPVGKHVIARCGPGMSRPRNARVCSSN